MTAALADKAAMAPNTNLYEDEVRFGIVMYGGVSLAIYINGVAHELFEMTCATPRPGVVIDASSAGETREIYRRLSALTGHPECIERYAQRIRQRQRQADVWDESIMATGSRTRFVVDVISGTSAGGINGVFLAKALVNGERFDTLRDLWIEESDVAKLLNDGRFKEPAADAVADHSSPPKSLLDSDRMYRKLLAALQAMQALPVKCDPTPDATSPLVDELDLFLTTTDIRGTLVPLSLHDKLVHERRHKQSFHFAFPSPMALVKSADPKSDFDAEHQAFLAFAARCTSSFPVAFEPMTLAHVGTLVPGESEQKLRRFDRYFESLNNELVRAGEHLTLPFGDGGVLDNKPFSYVADTLSRRFGDEPARRMLLYVEPDPEWLERENDSRRARQPNAVTFALDALFTIPMYETIREDLQTVLARNRRIERIEGLVHQSEAAIERDAQARGNPFGEVKLIADKVPKWRTRTQSEMVKYYGRSVLPYRQLRVYAATDRLAHQLAQAWDIDTGGDRFHALRTLVRDWRERRYNEELGGVQSGKETFNEFLYRFDFDYRVRRLAFLLRRIDRLTAVLRRPHLRANANDADSLDSTLTEAWERHCKAFTLEHTETPVGAHHSDSRAKAVNALRCLKRLLRLNYLDLLRWRRSPAAWRASVERSKEQREQLAALLDALIQSGPGESALEPTLLQRMLECLSALEASGDAALNQVRSDLARRIDALAIDDDDKQPDSPNALTTETWNLLGNPQLQAAGEPLEARLVVSQSTSSRGSAELVDLSSPEAMCIKRMLGESYLMFDQIDQTRFTAYYETGTGEPTRVDVLRISPVDAVSLVKETAQTPPERRKLAGTALAHFAAFLDERWRRNDQLWGRLDGAERLISALLPPVDDDSKLVHAELVEIAQRRILSETLLAEDREKVVDLVFRALREVSGDGLLQRLRQILRQLASGNRQQRERLAQMLSAVLSEQGLVERFRTNHRIDLEPEPRSTLQSAARAVRISGYMLKSVSNDQGATSTLARWVARAGLVLQGAVAVSMPDTLLQRWWSGGMVALYTVEVMVLAIAMLFGTSEFRTAAVTALLATCGVHLATLLLKDRMRGRKFWLRCLTLAGVLCLVLLASLGAYAVLEFGLNRLFCGFETTRPMSEWLGRFCPIVH